MNLLHNLPLQRLALFLHLQGSLGSFPRCPRYRNHNLRVGSAHRIPPSEIEQQRNPYQPNDHRHTYPTQPQKGVNLAGIFQVHVVYEFTVKSRIDLGRFHDFQNGIVQLGISIQTGTVAGHLIQSLISRCPSIDITTVSRFAGIPERRVELSRRIKNIPLHQATLIIRHLIGRQGLQLGTVFHGRNIIARHEKIIGQCVFRLEQLFLITNIGYQFHGLQQRRVEHPTFIDTIAFPQSSIRFGELRFLGQLRIIGNCLLKHFLGLLVDFALEKQQGNAIVIGPQWSCIMLIVGIEALDGRQVTNNGRIEHTLFFKSQPPFIICLGPIKTTPLPSTRKEGGHDETDQYIVTSF